MPRYVANGERVLKPSTLPYSGTPNLHNSDRSEGLEKTVILQNMGGVRSPSVKKAKIAQPFKVNKDLGGQKEDTAI